VTAGPIAQKLRAQAELLAEADVPVLILGESGSGKDSVARLIHKLSVRSGFKFLKVNCADMPAELLEAELFGSGRNSASGAQISQGKFERAERGTIFLDEITEMPLALQAQLMQLLQEKQLWIAPGREHAVPVDVRVLASTGVNIERALAQGKLREDLYYRLSAFTVQVPPLRQRRSEIAVLLRHLMHKLSRHYSLPAREFAPSVLDACQQHTWPGNLKELEAFAKRYLVAGDSEFSFGEVDTPLAESGHATRPPLRKSDLGTGNGQDSLPKSLKSLIQSVKGEAERNAIAAALNKTGWNRKAAARLLQVSYRTLLYKIDQYQMSVPEPLLSPLPRERYSFEESAKSNGNGKAS
jgi:transcriptional regulator with PAS, ATPase and Fis domain